MDPPEPKLPTQPRTSDPLLLGTLYGGASALGYTAANICLRQVALDADPVWVSCIKAVPVATVASCIVASGLWRGLTMFPPPRQIVLLLLSAVFMQLAGNVAFQWALGNIGLAVTVPLSFGCMLLGVAVLGRLWLLEPITPRSALAILVLLASITVLSFAANTGGEFPNDATFAWIVVLAGGRGRVPFGDRLCDGQRGHSPYAHRRRQPLRNALDHEHDRRGRLGNLERSARGDCRDVADRSLRFAGHAWCRGI